MPANRTQTFFWIFQTKFKWTAAASVGGRLAFLSFGHKTAEKAAASWRKAAQKFFDGEVGEEKEWDADFFKRIINYVEGGYEDFRDVPVNLEGYTAFQRKVLTVCRQIPIGATRSYGELAAMAGANGAARAAGSCMAKNRIPLVIPCHRVIHSDGSLGSYSAVGGKIIKAELLENEKESVKLACLE